MSIKKKKICSLCGVRKGKRECLREDGYICAKCCGETRDIKECPKTCEYLQPLLKQKGKLAEIKRAFLDEELGTNSLIIEYRNTSGKWSCCISIIDLWKGGYEGCYGLRDVSEEKMNHFLSRNKEMFDYERIKWKEALQIIKRGLDIRKELQLAYPNEYYEFKDILAETEKIEIEGTVYKCASCGGDLPEENIEILKKIALETDDFYVADADSMEFIYCDECEEEMYEESDLTDESDKIFGLLREKIKSNIENNDYPEIRQEYESLMKEGYSQGDAITEMAKSITGEVFTGLLTALTNEDGGMGKSEDFSLIPIDCSECTADVVCPTCNSSINHGWSVYNISAILCDKCGTLFFCDTLEIIEKFPKDDKELLEAKAKKKLVKYFNLRGIVSEPSSPQVKAIKLQKAIEIDKTDPIYELVHKITLVNEKKDEFKDNFTLMEQKLKPISKKILKKGREAVPALIAHLYDFDSWSCIFAVRLLGEIKDERAIEPIMDALEVPYFDYLNEEAVFALVKYGELVVDPLIERTMSRLEITHIDEDGVELNAIFLLGTLGKIHLPKVYSFLENLLKNRREYQNLDINSLIGCFWDQENPAIIPELKNVVREYGTAETGREAIATIEELKKFR